MRRKNATIVLYSPPKDLEERFSPGDRNCYVVFSFFNGAHEATVFAVWSVLTARSVPQVWLFETGSPVDTEASETFVLQPVVPGLNMPLVIPLLTVSNCVFTEPLTKNTYA